MSIDPSRRRGTWLVAVALTSVAALAVPLLVRAQDETAQEPLPEEPEVQPADPYAVELPDEEDAEPGGEGLEGSYFATSLSSSAGWEEGFLLQDDEEGDGVFRLTPRLLLVHAPSERTELTAAYAPELESFQEHSDLDTVHHAGGAAFRHDLTRRSRLLAGGSILDGEDPTRQLGGLYVLLPRVAFTQSRVYAGYEHRWQRTSVLLHLGHTRTEVEAASEAALFTGVDQRENLGALTILRSLTPRTDLSASYSFVDPSSDLPAEVDPDDPGAAPERIGVDQPIQTLTLGLGHRASPRLALQVSGGVLEQDDELSWVGAAEVLRSGDPVSFRVRYDRSLLSFGTGSIAGEGVPVQPGTPAAALGDTLTDAVSVGFLARLSDRVRWRQLFDGALTDLPAGESLESLATSGRLTVEATRRLAPFLELEYRDQRGSDLFGEAITRWRAALGIVVGVTGPEAAWGVREAPERLNTLLPDRTGAFDG